MNKISNNKNNLSPIDDFRNFLKQLFPDMKSAIIEKNIDFTIILEDYKGIGIHGIEDFLDKKKYILEGVKYINIDIYNIYLTESQEKKIISGKYNIGLKIFSRNIGNKVEFSIYYIIAEKKDMFTFDWVGDKVKELISKKESNA